MKAISRARKFLVFLDMQFTEAVLRLIALMVKAPRHPPDPDWAARPSRILLLRYDRIGDMITSTALVRAITEARPNVTVDVLASPVNADIIRRQKQRGDVLVYDLTKRGSFWRLVSQLRSRNYDAVLDGLVLRNSITARRSLIMLLSGARYRIGRAGRRYDFVYNLKTAPGNGLAPPSHHIDLLALLAKPFGIDVPAVDWRPSINLTQQEREFAERSWPPTDGAPRMRFLVNISAGQDEARHWPRERYAAAILHLRSAVLNSSVVVIARADEYEAAVLIARESGATALAPGLFESFALVESADLFLTPDTGLVHAASAFQTPIVTLRRTGQEAWLPYRTPSRSVFAILPARVDTIELSRVQVAIDEMLAEHRVRSSSTRRPGRSQQFQAIPNQ